MAIEIKVPSPGESITEVEIASWLVEDGSYVEMDTELVEINSDKATLMVNAEASGVVKIMAKAGDTVAVGQVIASIDTAAAAPAKKEQAEGGKEKAETIAADSKTEVSKSKSFAEGVPSVSAEKLMKEKGIDSGSVEGSGRGGRITKTDVVKQGDGKSKEKVPENGKKQTPAPVAGIPAFGGGSREKRRVKMSLLRRKIAERLVSVKNETAMLTTFNEVDMHEIMALRNKYKDKFKEKYGVGLGFMGFFTKACWEALKIFPAINAQVDGEEMIFHDYADIGVAVSTDRGLVVPNIRNAESMSILQIEKTILDFGLRGREGKISMDEMLGGTFSITNGGVFGSMLSTPILNPPQSAILGMHNIVQRPVAINGEVKIRPIMFLALSYDHRIVDGKEAVSFLVKVKEFLEDPARLLLGI